VGALTRRLDALPPPRVEEPPRILADRPVRDIASAITAAWPTSSAGELVAMWVASAEPLRIRVVHLGAPVGSAGMHLLATAIAPTEKLAIEEDALAPAEAPSVEAARWLPLAFSLVDRAARHDLWVCITTPAPPEPDEARPKPDKARPKSKPVEDPTIAEVRKLIEAHVADRPKVVLGVSDRWSIVAKRVACEGSLTPPEDPKESK
jgi:hypothetical protein